MDPVKDDRRATIPAEMIRAGLIKCLKEHKPEEITVKEIDGSHRIPFFHKKSGRKMPAACAPEGASNGDWID